MNSLQMSASLKAFFFASQFTGYSQTGPVRVLGITSVAECPRLCKHIPLPASDAVDLLIGDVHLSSVLHHNKRRNAAEILQRRACHSPADGTVLPSRQLGRWHRHRSRTVDSNVRPSLRGRLAALCGPSTIRASAHTAFVPAPAYRQAAVRRNCGVASLRATPHATPETLLWASTTSRTLTTDSRRRRRPDGRSATRFRAACCTFSQSWLARSGECLPAMYRSTKVTWSGGIRANAFNCRRVVVMNAGQRFIPLQVEVLFQDGNLFADSAGHFRRQGNGFQARNRFVHDVSASRICASRFRQSSHDALICR